MSQTARRAIERADDDILVSSVSAYEMSNKRRIGKLNGVDRLIDGLSDYVVAQRFVEMPVSIAHATLAGSLAFAHRDPFDRLLIAQAQLENAWLVSNEKLFDGFGVRRLW